MLNLRYVLRNTIQYIHRHIYCQVDFGVKLTVLGKVRAGATGPSYSFTTNEKPSPGKRGGLGNYNICGMLDYIVVKSRKYFRKKFLFARSINFFDFFCHNILQRIPI